MHPGPRVPGQRPSADVQERPPQIDQAGAGWASLVLRPAPQRRALRQQDLEARGAVRHAPLQMRGLRLRFVRWVLCCCFVLADRFGSYGHSTSQRQPYARAQRVERGLATSPLVTHAWSANGACHGFILACFVAPWPCIIQQVRLSFGARLQKHSSRQFLGQAARGFPVAGRS